MALFGIFVVKFFDYVFSHALKIFQQICSKIAHFIPQSEFRKKSNIKDTYGISVFKLKKSFANLESYTESFSRLISLWSK
ncbi:hypothetical protein ELAC_1783 [Estrella lausannensis]|uniref:Uncharacterized protein n=1 Tax=Estrella lausannensis TaxID=483423 RepID=A0A0H5DTE9_9BACT|nr:hypothetical protein ELAC_1783 [Estrella lausannensis]